MEEFTSLQCRLMQLRDERCGGNSAELARRIKKDATYVNRLFYPAGKAGAKGIGLEIMNACNEAFGLPAGYWEGVLAYWPFSEELQQTVAGLDPVATDRLENVIRAHLGMEMLQKLAAARREEETPETLLPSMGQNRPTGSAVRSGLTVVQPDKPAIPAPALDAEDVRQRGLEKHGSGTTRSPTRPKGNGDPR